MPEIEREPCPRCGEPAALSGRVCPHCQGSLLVDVILDAAVADPRARYHVARELSSTGAPAPAFAALQQTLASPRPVLARGLTRTESRRFLELVGDVGLEGRIAPQATPERATGGGGGGIPKLAIGLGAAAGIVLAAFLLLRPDDSTRAGGEAPAIAPTGAVPVPVAESRQGRQLSPRDLAALATPSTVMLQADGRIGTGFFVASDLVLTNAHVAGAAGARVEAVFADGRRLPGQTSQSEEWLDLALVRVPGARAEPLPLGDSMTLETGDRVVFIGTPEGLEFTVHQGIVSHTARQNLGVAYVQLDANVNPGNSGGPVLDDRGRVVGVVTAKIEGASGLGLVLPINYAYEGSSTLLPRPQPGPDPKRWQALLAGVAKADRAAADEAAAAAAKPFLLSAAMTQRGVIVAAVVRFSQGPPSSETVFFTFSKASRMVCGVTAPIDRWLPAATDVLGENPRIARWLASNGISRDAYMGYANLNLKECPLDELPGSEMVLEGADEGANRIPIS